MGRAFTHPEVGSAASGVPTIFAKVSPEGSGASDVAQIKQAVSSVVSDAVAAGVNYAEVRHDLTQGPYHMLEGAGGSALDTSQLGRSLVPFPVVASTAEKVLLRFTGPEGASAFPHWQQTAVQKAGLVYLTDLNVGFDNTLGSASLLGGPTAQQLGTTDGGFSNICVAIDGLTIVSTYSDPLFVGLDLQCVAECLINELGGSGNITPPTHPALPVAGGILLRMPQAGNNAFCVVGRVAAEGFTIGTVIGEHTNAKEIDAVYCGSGVYYQAPQADSAQVNYLMTEACKYHINTGDAVASGPFMCDLSVGRWDMEDDTNVPTTAHVNDPLNFLLGTIPFHRNNGAGAGGAADGKTGEALDIIQNGGSKAKFINVWVPPGRVSSPPAVPASGTAFPKIYRDASYYFTGGTLTGAGITVDGGTVGVTSGHVRVPAGRSLAVNYSAVPTLAALVLD